jgi:uncharacterized membrane protein
MRRLLEPGNRLLAGLIAATLIFLSSSSLPFGTRIVFAWNTGVTVLLGLIAIMMKGSNAHETRQRARNEEITSAVVLLVNLVTVAGALVFIAYGLPSANSMSPTLRAFHIFLSLSGVFLAWLLIHISYSLHYAKLYYSKVSDRDANAFMKGLAFPGGQDEVDYWDFVYYAFTIAMCYQTSDISILTPYMRRLTIFHAAVSYFFTLVILGLVLDVIANII